MMSINQRTLSAGASCASRCGAPSCLSWSRDQLRCTRTLGEILPKLKAIKDSPHVCPRRPSVVARVFDKTTDGGELPGNGGPTISSAMSSSLGLAIARARESQSLQAQQEERDAANGVHERTTLVLDPFAQPLLDHAQPAHVPVPLVSDTEALRRNLTTRYIDDTLLQAMAATNVNTINSGDYRQVVLIGDGMDTRPFRLPWPEGTLIFMVAPREAHEFAAAAMKAGNAHVPRGCLLRRIPADPAYPLAGSDGELPSILPQLEAAGYQGDKLSVWVVQGLSGQSVSQEAVVQLMTDITNGAAFNSLVLGELPAHMTHQAAQNLLADVGLLSAVIGYDNPAVSLGKWSEQHQHDLLATATSNSTQPWLFTSQQLRLSLTEMGVYEAHRAVAEEVDEDYFDNFS